MIQNELRDLKTKLKLKEEYLGFEKETNQSLQKKIDNMNNAYNDEIQACKKEHMVLRHEND
jgi:hypothetical protein